MHLQAAVGALPDEPARLARAHATADAAAAAAVAQWNATPAPSPDQRAGHDVCVGSTQGATLATLQADKARLQVAARRPAGGVAPSTAAAEVALLTKRIHLLVNRRSAASTAARRRALAIELEWEQVQAFAAAAASRELTDETQRGGVAPDLSVGAASAAGDL